MEVADTDFEIPQPRRAVEIDPTDIRCAKPYVSSGGNSIGRTKPRPTSRVDKFGNGMDIPESLAAGGSEC